MEKTELEKALKNTLIASGKDANIIQPGIEAWVRLGTKLFWGARPWTFTFKTGTLTLGDGDSTINCPSDCAAVVGVSRLTDNDYGWNLVPLPPREFDARFPYPGAAPESQTVFYKVESDDGTKKITPYPVSASDDTASIVYKVAYSENAFFRLAPDVMEPYILSACLYQAMVGQDRMSQFNEWRRALNEAKQIDRLDENNFVGRSINFRTPWARDSWQFLLSGGNYYAS